MKSAAMCSYLKVDGRLKLEYAAVFLVFSQW